ncbi:type VI secretion system tube protein TssD [Xenorhabdus sp. SGI246]|uniref:type VI secretion system tube protein TssD n=1 Tax=Xenorhabdus sp. SGI246 TaxID=3158263 RepID=UPI00349F58CA
MSYLFCDKYQASIGNQYQQRHEDEIFVLSIRHSIIRNQNVMHHPLEFIKLIDKSSPLLGMAISDNEKLEGITHNDRQPQEIISIIYKDIVWKNHAENTSGYSIWSDRTL